MKNQKTLMFVVSLLLSTGWLAAGQEEQFGGEFLTLFNDNQNVISDYVTTFLEKIGLSTAESFDDQDTTELPTTSHNSHGTGHNSTTKGDHSVLKQVDTKAIRSALEQKAGLNSQEIKAFYAKAKQSKSMTEFTNWIKKEFTGPSQTKILQLLPKGQKKKL